MRPARSSRIRPPEALGRHAGRAPPSGELRPSAAGLEPLEGSAPPTPEADPLRPTTRSGKGRFGATLLRSVLSGVCNPRGEDPEIRSDRAVAAVAALRGFAPRDTVEAMMAAQAVVLHLAAMECARRAMLPDQPGEAAARLRRDTASLSRGMVDMAEAIERRRGKGPQVVRVERVVVNEGGQAIVGTVLPGAASQRGGGGRRRR